MNSYCPISMQPRPWSPQLSPSEFSMIQTGLSSTLPQPIIFTACSPLKRGVPGVTRQAPPLYTSRSRYIGIIATTGPFAFISFFMLSSSCSTQSPSTLWILSLEHCFNSSQVSLARAGSQGKQSSSQAPQTLAQSMALETQPLSHWLFIFFLSQAIMGMAEILVFLPSAWQRRSAMAPAVATAQEEEQLPCSTTGFAHSGSAVLKLYSSSSMSPDSEGWHRQSCLFQGWLLVKNRVLASARVSLPKNPTWPVVKDLVFASCSRQAGSLTLVVAMLTVSLLRPVQSMKALTSTNTPIDILQPCSAHSPLLLVWNTTWRASSASAEGFCWGDWLRLFGDWLFPFQLIQLRASILPCAMYNLEQLELSRLSPKTLVILTPRSQVALRYQGIFLADLLPPKSPPCDRLRLEFAQARREKLLNIGIKARRVILQAAEGDSLTKLGDNQQHYKRELVASYLKRQRRQLKKVLQSQMKQDQLRQQTHIKMQKYQNRLEAMKQMKEEKRQRSLQRARKKQDRRQSHLKIEAKKRDQTQLFVLSKSKLAMQKRIYRQALKKQLLKKRKAARVASHQEFRSQTGHSQEEPKLNKDKIGDFQEQKLWFRQRLILKRKSLQAKGQEANTKQHKFVLTQQRSQTEGGDFEAKVRRRTANEKVRRVSDGRDLSRRQQKIKWTLSLSKTNLERRREEYDRKCESAGMPLAQEQEAKAQIRRRQSEIKQRSRRVIKQHNSMLLEQCRKRIESRRTQKERSHEQAQQILRERRAGRLVRQQLKREQRLAERERIREKHNYQRQRIRQRLEERGRRAASQLECREQRRRQLFDLQRAFQIRKHSLHKQVGLVRQGKLQAKRLLCNLEDQWKASPGLGGSYCKVYE